MCLTTVIFLFQVNFSSLSNNLLVSGSSDHSIKLFDLRFPSGSVTTLKSSFQGVRDVQFNPIKEVRKYQTLASNK